MLDAETKRRIDTARDILVGKVPDPKSQVEQITIALIYKFMDDMDAESEELGGNRKFFAGEFGQYGWPKLVRSGLGGHEVLNLYSEAITRMPENPGIPPLFRDIFKNAFLPYRDPETLRAFLKIIDEFEYDHSERLGDAFEYLLSVLGSQGDAGQFRTPRHIIDFIVGIIDPKKDETILDPACGTAGFLVSSYKHILKSNTDDKGHSTLTPDEKGKLADNFKGYDISPDMVRLSLVNLYLHGFVAPQIYEYDTLTSEDRWNEYADVILANPPFMSPKGGIRPHNRFSVKSKRSEVLFVDYMAEHLTPNGRAGIIVPEGIIFQSQNAYKQLRKMLVEEYLVAVVSLPAGVFNPYSGVKTSILILDKVLARRRDSIGFFRVENDGFDLGSQRRAIDGNDLPQIGQAVTDYLSMDGQDMQDKDSSEAILNKLAGQGSVQIVAKERIAANGEYNLNGERYRELHPEISHWPMVSLGLVANIESGSRQKGGAVNSGIPSIGGEQIDEKGNIRFDKMKYISKEHFRAMKKGVLKNGDVLMVKDGATTGKTGFFAHNLQAAVNEHVFILRSKETIRPYYMYSIIRSHAFQERLRPFIKGIIGGISLEIQGIEIPLPPLEVQRGIVAEIEGYQKVIDGARAVVENYRPHITIDPAWPMLEIAQIAAPNKYSIKAGPFGSALRKQSYVSHGYKIYGQEQVIKGDAAYGDYYISKEKYLELENCKVQAGDVLISLVGTFGKTLIIPQGHESGIINPRLMKITLDKQKMTPEFFTTVFAQDTVTSQIHMMSHGGTMNILNVRVLKHLQIPVPPLKTQEAIVAEIESDQALVDSNNRLIERFKKKIQGTINRVWEG